MPQVKEPPDFTPTENNGGKEGEGVSCAVTETSAFLSAPNDQNKDDRHCEVPENYKLVELHPTSSPQSEKASNESDDLGRTSDDDDKSGNNEGTKKKGLCACQNYLGILFTLGSGFIFTVGGLIVKYMKDFHPITLAAFRFQGVFLPALLLALYSHFVKKEIVFGTIWPLTEVEKRKRFIFATLRGILGGSALICLFYSIQNLSLADAILINSSRPVFVVFVAHIFLREPCGIFPVFAALLSIIGVGVIARPPILTGAESFDKESLMGVGFAFIGMLTTAVAMVILRYLRGAHVSMVTLNFGIWGTVISAIGSTIIGRFDIPTTRENIILALCLALATFFAQVGITLAMKYEQAGSVAIVRSCDTIFAFILQFLVLGVVPDVYSFIGAVLIVSCVLMIAFRKWVSTLPEQHAARRIYWFVLK